MFAKYLGLLLFGISVFGVSYHYSARFLDWLRFQSLGTRDYIVDRLALMFIEVDPQKVLLGLLAISFVPASLVFVAFLPEFFPGIPLALLVALIGWKAPKPIVDYMYRRRINTFVIQMIDALSLMSNGLKSGLSIVQALGLVTEEMPDPIRSEFNRILEQNKLGVALEECFTSLSERVKVDDVEMFVTAINILKETGGNLAETFDTIVQTIRDRIKVENKISALTAQGIYQGIFVAAIPPIMGVFFYQSDPDFMRPMFTTALGWILILIIFMLEVIGFFVIMKIIKIDV